VKNIAHVDTRDDDYSSHPAPAGEENPDAVLTLRQAVPGTGDVADLLASEQQAFGDKSFTIWAVEPLCRHGAAYLFEFDGNVVGHALLMKEWTNPASVYLASFAIDSHYRGRGLGRRSLRLLLDELRGQDIALATLTVDPVNQSACGLYRSEGFYVNKTVSDQYGPGEDRYVMAVSLSAEKCMVT